MPPSNLYAYDSPDQPLSIDTIGVIAEVPITLGGPTPTNLLGKAQVVTPQIGFQIFADGLSDVDFISSGRALPRVGSWQVDPGQQYILMSAAWDNSAPDAQVEVTYRLVED